MDALQFLTVTYPVCIKIILRITHGRALMTYSHFRGVLTFTVCPRRLFSFSRMCQFTNTTRETFAYVYIYK